MDTYMHKTMASVASQEKIEIIRSWEFMLSEARLKFLKKMIILGPKIAIILWGFNFVEFWCWGLIFGDRGGPGPRPWLNTPIACMMHVSFYNHDKLKSNICTLLCILWLITVNFPYYNWYQT